MLGTFWKFLLEMNCISIICFEIKCPFIYVKVMTFKDPGEALGLKKKLQLTGNLKVFGEFCEVNLLLERLKSSQTKSDENVPKSGGCSSVRCRSYSHRGGTVTPVQPFSPSRWVMAHGYQLLSSGVALWEISSAMSHF